MRRKIAKAAGAENRKEDGAVDEKEVALVRRHARRA